MNNNFVVLLHLDFVVPKRTKMGQNLMLNSSSLFLIFEDRISVKLNSAKT